MRCDGAFVTLSATKPSRELYGVKITDCMADWGPPWYANASAITNDTSSFGGRVAIKVNETRGSFDRSRIVGTQVEGNTFTGVDGRSTRADLRLRREHATVWEFDVCKALLFHQQHAGQENGQENGQHSAAGASMSTSTRTSTRTPPSLSQLQVQYTIQIEGADFARHKLGNVSDCRVQVVTDVSVTGTVFLHVDESRSEVLYVPLAPP